MVTADTTNFSSPPQAMLTSTPPVTDNGAVASASGSHGVRQTGAHFRMQADIRVDSSCFANGDYDRIMIMGVEYPTESYGMAMHVTPAATSDGGILLSAGTVEITYGPDGGSTIFSGQGDSGFFPPDQWQTFTIWADLPSEGGYGVSPAKARERRRSSAWPRGSLSRTHAVGGRFRAESLLDLERLPAVRGRLQCLTNRK
jgi:hypothetical protein